MFYKGEKMEVHKGPGTDFHGYGKAIRRELKRRIPIRRKIRVLDVGTGFGINVAFLVDILRKDSEIWSIDPSEEVIAEAKAAIGEAVPKVNFVKATADHLEFADGFFDVIVSVMVMHHMEDVRSALKELTRVLATGGRVLVVDYKPEAAHKLEFQSMHHESDFIKPEKLRKLVEGAGIRSELKDFELWYLLDGERLEGPKGR